MRIVLDTNLIISGFFFGGIPRNILELWRKRSFELICSPEILEEYEDVLFRLIKKSGKGDAKFVNRVMSMLTKDSIIVQPGQKVQLSRDSDDDKFIDCALSGKALYIVSGDNDLLEIEKVEGIEIITAREFIDRMSN